MKIGFSFGRCVRDIVKGEVAIEDVLVIVARTRCETLEHLLDVCDHYAYEAFSGLDMEECKVVSTALFNAGKIHQPRVLGAWPGGVADNFVWMEVVPTAKDLSPGVKEAWESYRLMLGICAEEPIPDAKYAPNQ